MRAVEYREEKCARAPLKALKRDGIIGSSAHMNHCFDQLAQAASSVAPVLIFGETGTGKELFARAIHENSPRSSGSFVVVDCAALPDTLVESALFGYKKGAFTGADCDTDGLIAQADGGTLFLDEVGELPLVLQKAFLRVLQEHRYRPIGSGTELHSNFRVVAASNRDLREMASAGNFRKDLLFRLESLSIEVPPLRARADDVQELALYYVDRLCRRYGMETKGVTPEFFDALAAYSWPGNVRELVNTLERVLSAARNDPTLYPHHLPDAMRIQLKRNVLEKETVEERCEKSPYASGTFMQLPAYREMVACSAEKHYLTELRRQAQGDVARACSLSGLSRPRLYALFKKYDMSIKGD
jgi:two-component system NtrC family response regulator